MSIPLVLVLWEHPGFGGRRRTFVGDTVNLATDGFNDTASAVGVHPGPGYAAWKAANGGAEPTVTLYEHAGYGGAALTLKAGAYANIHMLFNFGDAVSSLRFNAPAAAAPTISPIRLVVELFEHANFTGRRAVIVENVSNVIAYLGSDWNDIVSSARVTAGPNFTAGNAALLFRDANYLGGSISLPPGNYPNIGASHAFNDVVSSVQV
jgi:Beta/Gamma crystallin